MIEFQHVFKSYGQGPNILADLNFKINPGEFIFVSGPSGAGKSTLLKLIGGLERPSRGMIAIKGQRLDKLQSRERPYLRRRVGIILQDTHLLYDRSALANVMLPMAVMGHSTKSAEARARAAIYKVGLGGKERMNPVELSGGEQQRLAIARAIVNKPSLLLADEPTGNLDPELSMEVLRLFEAFNRVGVSVLIATHDTGLINSLRYRTLTLNSGRLQAEETA